MCNFWMTQWAKRHKWMTQRQNNDEKQSLPANRKVESSPAVSQTKEKAKQGEDKGKDKVNQQRSKILKQEN